MISYRLLNPCSGSAIMVIAIFGDDSKDLFYKLVGADFECKNPEVIENKNYLSNIFVEGDVLDEALVCFRNNEYLLYLHASQAILTKIELFFAALGVIKEKKYTNVPSEHRALQLVRSRYACHLLASTSISSLKEAIESSFSNDNYKRLSRLNQRSKYIIMAQSPQSVFLVGPTNAGKSTLFNILADKELALVSNIKYTTRDSLSCSVIIDGLEVELYDTPGSGEFAGAEQDQQSYDHFSTLLDEADIVIKFMPLDQPLNYEISKNINVLHVFSKSDLADKKVLGQLPAEAVVFSAKNEVGLDALREAVFDKLYPHPIPKIGETLCFSKKQSEIVSKVCKIWQETGLNTAMEFYKDNEKTFQ